MAEVALKGNPIHTIGDLPQSETQAPEFSLTKIDLSEISSQDLKGKRLVLNIFPSIDTAVCATSVRTFNAKANDLENTTILCISQDLPFALKRFCGSEGLEKVLPVSAFRNPKFGESYGVTLTDGPLKGLFARALLVVDETGKIIHQELVPEIAQEPNYEAALATLA